MAKHSVSALEKIYTDRQGRPYLVRDARRDDGTALVELLDRVGREQIYIADEFAQLTADQESQLIAQRNPLIHQ